MKGLSHIFLSFVCLLLCLSLLSCADTSLAETKTYTVTCYPENGVDPVTVTAREGVRIARLDNPYKEGYIFDDWYTDAACTIPYDFSAPVRGNVTLYAGYFTDYASLTNHVTAEAIPATVTVLATHSKRVSFAQTATTVSTGSGVIFHKTGNTYYLLTNYHVISLKDGYTSVTYAIEDYCGNEIEATLEAQGEAYDLAILSFNTDKNYPVLSLADDNPALNEEIICLGQPKGQTNAITYGKVTDLSSEDRVEGSAVSFPVIHHSAPLAQGSSGGAILNLDFEIVGINFAVATTVNGENFAFGLSVPLVKILEFLSQHWYP